MSIAAMLLAIRSGARLYRRNAWTVILAATALALGTGVALAVYQFTLSVFRPPLHIQGAERVAAVLYGTPASLARTHVYSDFVLYKDHARVFDAVAALVASTVVVESANGVETAVCHFVSPEYPSVLGIAAAGTLDAPSSAGYRAWVSAEFARRNGWQIGPGEAREMKVNGVVVSVLGAAPHGFAGLEAESKPDVWLPIGAMADVLRMSPSAKTTFFSARSNESTRIVARLRPGTSFVLAQDEVRRLHADANKGTRRWWAPADANIVVMAVEASRVLPQDGVPIKKYLRLNALVCGLLLLSAVLNGGGVMLVLFLDRRREMATRLAVGATRRSLAFHLFLEACMVAGAGVAGGLVVSSTLTQWAAQLLRGSRLQVTPPEALGPDTIALAVASSTVLAAFAVMIPVFRLRRVSVADDLKSGSAGERGRRWFSFSDVVIASQTALSVVLMTAAVPVVLYLWSSLGKPAGIRHKEALTISAEYRPPSTGPSAGDRTPRVYDTLLDDVRRVPGVKHAALAAVIQLGPRKFMRQVKTDPGMTPVSVDGNAVSGDYFDAVGTRILRGRPIRDDDRRDAPLVAVVNETFAATHWPGSDPLAHHVTVVVPNGSNLEFQIVGVAENGLYRDMEDVGRPFIYFSVHQHGWYQAMNLIVLPQQRLVPVLRDVIAAARRADTALFVTKTSDLASVMDLQLLRHRLGAELIAGAGVVALILTIMGVLVEATHTLKRRRPEIAIRVAMGADSGHIARMVLVRQGLTIGTGLVAGLACTVPTQRIIASAFAGVIPRPAAVALPLILLVAGTSLVTILATRRASAGDPCSALRV